MLPIPIYRCPDEVKPSQAEQMASICDKEYQMLTGKRNRTKGGDPIVCVSTAGVSGFWSLECNDPEIPRETLDQLVANIRKWEGARADPNNL